MSKEERLPTIDELMLDDSEGDIEDCLELIAEDEDEVNEPQEDDYVVYCDSDILQNGKCIAKFVKWDDIERFIRKHAKANNWFPSDNLINELPFSFLPVHDACYKHSMPH